MPSTQARIEVRCSEALKKQVAALARERGVSQSEIGLAALEDFFHKPPDPETVVQDALRRLETLFCTFVQVYLTTAPDLAGAPDAEKLLAARRGQQRYTQFRTVVTQALEAAAWPD
jgi:hypothetical protein